LALLATVLIVLAAYLGGYFWLGRQMYWYPAYVESGPPELTAIERMYSQRWLRTIYKPAGWIEANYRGVKVLITYGQFRPPGEP
jgi:hypothetical protein